MAGVSARHPAFNWDSDELQIATLERTGFHDSLSNERQRSGEVSELSFIHSPNPVAMKPVK